MKKITFFVGIVCWVGMQTGYAQSFNEGLKFLENENFAAALKTFKTLAIKEPTNPLYSFYIGEVLYVSEDYIGAEKVYKEGIKINSKAIECHIGLAKIKLDQGKGTEAQAIFDLLTKQNKKNAAVFSLIGKSFLIGKKPNAAKSLEYLGKSRDMNPNAATTWAYLGDAYKLMDNNGDAMSSYERAVEKDPIHLKARMNIAKIWASARETDRAVKSLQSVIALDSNYAPAYKILIELYVRIRLYKEVTPLLEKYIALVGNDVDSKVRLVKFLCFEAKDYDRSITKGLEVLASHPDQYTLHRWLAWSYYEKENYQHSYDHCKKLLAAAEKDPTRKLYDSDKEYYAKATYKIGKLDEAAIAYEEVLKFSPTKAHDYYGNLAKSYYEAKNYVQAIGYFEKKATIKRLNVSDLYSYGRSLQLTNKLAEADSIYVKVLASNPNYPLGWYRRIEITRKMDTIPTARTWIAKPLHEKMIEQTISDPVKYKPYLLDAYDYLSQFYTHLEDYLAALTNFEKLLQLDPTNANVPTWEKNISTIKNSNKPKKANR